MKDEPLIWGPEIRGYHQFEKPKAGPGEMILPEVKPRVQRYHYDNPDSYGALIAQTKGFPEVIQTKSHDFGQISLCNRVKRSSDILDIFLGENKLDWAYSLQKMNDRELIALVKRLRTIQLVHVRFVFGVYKPYRFDDEWHVHIHGDLIWIKQ